MNSSDQKLDIGFASPNLLNDLQKPTSPSLSRSTEKWMLSNVYPLLFRIALFGLYVLFFIYKCFLVSLFSLYKYRYRFLQMIRGTQNTRKRVVVVGGGYAGLCASHSLEDEFDVTLIDTKDYYEFTPSRLRTLVEPHHSFKVQIKYSDILTKSHIITDRASQATTSGVFTSNGEYFAYDYLVICTGSRYKESLFPTTSIDPQLLPSSQKTAIVLSARTERIDTYHSTLSDANKVLIVGGGTVGVELASEIIERFPQKEVVLIHSQSKLMNRSPEHAIAYTEQFFKKNNVTVITNERLIAQNGSFFKTDQGTIIEADLAFVCTGNVPNSELLQHDFPQHLNKYGFVKVNKNLQLNGCDNIFVAGDLTDIPEEEEKLCQTAYSEIKVVIANIYNQESRKSLKTYVPTKCPMLVSLGKYDGILTYRGWTMTGFLPAVMKEFVEWKEMVWYWNWSHFQLNRHQKFIDDEYIEKPGKSHDV